MGLLLMALEAADLASVGEINNPENTNINNIKNININNAESTNIKNININNAESTNINNINKEELKNADTKNSGHITKADKASPPNIQESYEVTTPQTWTQLHRIQALHAPEMCWNLRSRNLEGENGQHLSSGLRFHIEQSLSGVVRVEETRYHNKTQASKENLLTPQLALAWDRRVDQWWMKTETGHSGRLAGELAWERSIKSGAGFSLGASRRSVHESWLSMHYGEEEDRLKGGWNVQLPRDFFASGEWSAFSSRLVHAGEASGDGQSGFLELGVNLIPQKGHVIAWQFFERQMRYQDQLRQVVQLKISQQYERFDANTEYFSALSRTRSAQAQTLTAVMGLPFSQHSGWEGQIFTGRDLERGLDLGKIRGLNTRFLWIPTHITKLELNFSASTENSGVIKGDVYESSVSWNVNL